MPRLKDYHFLSELFRKAYTCSHPVLFFLFFSLAVRALPLRKGPAIFIPDLDLQLQRTPDMVCSSFSELYAKGI